MGKIKRIKVKGSYTVEAALIFPFILFIILALIYLGFYLHDVAKMQAIIHKSLVKGSAFIRNEMDINTGAISYEDYLDRTIFYPIDNDFYRKESEIKNYLYNQSADRFFISQIKDINVDISSSRIKINLSLDIKFPIISLGVFLTESSNLIFEMEGKIHDPMNFIRGFEVAAGIGKRIEGVNKILGELKDILGFLK